MGLILSIQGGMAVGKTTAIQWLAEHEPLLDCFFEDVQAPLQEVKRRALDKTNYCDYLKIQRIFIAHEVERWKIIRQSPCAVVDLGAGEIEFYTLHYPRSIGKDWPIASALAPELALLRQCKAQRTLFLQASPDVLRARKEADASRERGFFPHSTNILLPMKQQWFHAQPNTDFINTDNLSKEQLCKQVHDWVKQMLMELDNLSLNIKPFP